AHRRYTRDRRRQHRVCVHRRRRLGDRRYRAPRCRARGGGMSARRLAIALVVAVAFAAVFASFLAADRPLVLRWRGTTYWLPNLFHYDALDGLRGDELRAQMTKSDWAIWAPVRHSPTGVRSGGQLRPLEAPSSRHWLGTDD